MISRGRLLQIQLPMLLLVSCLLPSCSLSGRSAPPVKPQLAVIDTALMRPCPPLATIPAGDQPPAIVFPLLYEDVANYKVCRARHDGLVSAVKARDAMQGVP